MNKDIIQHLERMMYFVRELVEDYNNRNPNKEISLLLIKMLDLISCVYYPIKIKYSYNENYSFTLDNNYKIELERIFLSIIIDKILHKNDRGVHFHEFIAALIINIYYQITKEKENRNKFYKVAKHLINQYVRSKYKEITVTVFKSPIIRISDITEEFEYLLKHKEDN